MIASAIAAVLVSFGACVALTPVVRKFCFRFAAVDRPGPLKIHSRPVPRLGGIAVALSIAAALFVAAPRQAHGNCFFAALGAIWIVGLADDLRSLPPIARLTVQIVPGILLWLGGWRLASLPFLPRAGIASLLCVSAVIVLFANSFNFLDGSDGIAAGVAAIIAACYLAVSHVAAPDPFAFALCCALLGSSIGFEIFNFPPARIFLGDSGSTALGFCIGFLTLTPAQPHTSVGSLALVPFALAGLPLLDAALALVRRLLCRSSPLHGDRRHFYDLLLARRWTARKVAFACYGITLALGVLAWLSLRISFRCFEISSAASTAVLLLLAIGLGSLRAENSRREHLDQICDGAMTERSEPAT